MLDVELWGGTDTALVVELWGTIVDGIDMGNCSGLFLNILSNNDCFVQPNSFPFQIIFISRSTFNFNRISCCIER